MGPALPYWGVPMSLEFPWKSSIFHRGSDSCNRDSGRHVRHPNQHAWQVATTWLDCCMKSWLRKKNGKTSSQGNLEAPPLKKNVVVVFFLRNLTPKMCVIKCVFVSTCLRNLHIEPLNFRRCKYIMRSGQTIQIFSLGFSWNLTILHFTTFWGDLVVYICMSYIYILTHIYASIRLYESIYIYTCVCAM